MGLNVCTKEEKEKCTAEIGNEEFAEWACKECEKTKDHEIHPWTQHLIELRFFLKAGYPIQKDDLSFYEWKDLGILMMVLDSNRGML